MGIDPGSIALMSLAVGAAGTGVSAFGQEKQGEATQAADLYKAQVATNNAAIAKQSATLDIQSGEIAAVNKGLQTKAKVGSELATQGASGIDVNSGSAPMVRAGTAEIGMLDSLTIRSNAAKKAWSDEVEANNDTAQSQLDTAAGANAQEAGEIGAAGSLLSGAATVGKNYTSFQTKFGSSGDGSTIGGVSRSVDDPTIGGLY